MFGFPINLQKTRIFLVTVIVFYCNFIQVVLHSKHAPGNALFNANLKTGKAEVIPIPKADKNGLSYELDSELAVPDEYKVSNNTFGKATFAAAAVPTTGFK